MARQLIGVRKKLTASEEAERVAPSVAVDSPLPVEVPESPASLPPTITTFRSTVVAVSGESAVHQVGIWQDSDMVNRPAFSANIGGVYRSTAQFGTSGAWFWQKDNPISTDNGSVVTVKIIDDQGLTAQVEFTIDYRFAPIVAVATGEEITAATVGDNVEVNGVWLDADMVASSKSVIVSVNPPVNGVLTYDHSGPLFINGWWKVTFTNIQLEDAGEYAISAVDADGNRAESATFRVDVSPAVANVLPTIDIDALVFINPLQLVSGDSLVLTGTWTDTDTAGVAVDIRASSGGGLNGIIVVDSPTGSGSTWSWTIATLTESHTGSYQFTITDGAGGQDTVSIELIVSAPATLTLNATPLTFDVADSSVVTSTLLWTDSDGIDTGPGTPGYTVSLGSMNADPTTGSAGTSTWTSPTLTNAVHDGTTVTITLEDANGNTADVTLTLNVRAPAATIPPTIDAPLLQPDTHGAAQYEARMQIGGEGLITGIWGDDDASGVAPVASITAIDNVDLLPFGTVSPATGATAFESKTGAWTISSFNHSAEQHNRIIIVEITDDDGLTAQVTIRLDLLVSDDPLRAISGHNEPSQAVWQAVNTNQNWTTDARATTYGAGYVLQNQFAAVGEQAEWELLTSTADDSVHVYRPQFVAYLPDDTTRIRAQVYRTLSGEEVEQLEQDSIFTGPLPVADPPPPSTEIPAIANDSLGAPFLEKSAGQTRAGFFSSVVTNSGGANYRLFYIVDNDPQGTGRDLWVATGSTPTSFTGDALLRANVETVSVEHDGLGGLRLFGTEKTSPTSDTRFFGGTSTDHVAWTWFLDPQPTGGYPDGDMVTMIDGKKIAKGHEFVPGDYFRHFFHDGNELTGMTPTEPGIRYEPYGVSIIKPSDHGWRSSWLYVGLVWLFRVDDAAQHGPIWPVWAVSMNLVNWTLPYGSTPAIERGSGWSAGMLMTTTNPVIVNDELLIYYSGSSFVHNSFIPGDPTQDVGLGLARVTKADFEAAFRRQVTAATTSLDPWTITLEDIDLSIDGDYARIVMWTEADGVVTEAMPQHRAGLLEKSFFEKDPLVLPPPLVGAEVWRFEPNRLSAAEWDDHVKVGSDFKSIPNSRLQALGGANRLAMAPGNQWIRFPINFVAPERNTDGSIRCRLSLGAPDDHCMFGPYAVGGVLEGGAYTKEGQAYRWAMTVDIPEGRDWSLIPWAILAQNHPGLYGNDWNDPQGRQPFIALYVSGGNFVAYARGSNQTNPVGYTHEIREEMPYASGEHDIVIEWREDPIAEFAGGPFCIIKIDDTELLNTTTPIGINYSGLGASKPQGQLTQGYYGGHPERLVAGGVDPALQPWVDFRYTRLSEIDGPT